LKLDKLLWAGIGFGIALTSVTAVILFLPIDGQDEEEDYGEKTGDTGGVYFLKIEGIEGESSDSGHDSWCEISSFSQSIIMRPSGGSSSGRTRAEDSSSIQTFTISKRVDKATPRILEACVNGELLSEVEIDFCSVGMSGYLKSYMTYTLKDVLIEGYSTQGQSGDVIIPVEETNLNSTEPKLNDDFIVINQHSGMTNYQPSQITGIRKMDTRPLEIVTISYEEIEVSYTESDDEGASKGKVEYTWKVEGAES
jgi:type VI secretion system secreted protein Hcp